MSELQDRIKDLTPDQIRILSQRLKSRKGVLSREEPSLPVLVHAPEERHLPGERRLLRRRVQVRRSEIHEPD